MASSPARWLGRRSYGLYPWHFPLLSVVVHQAPAEVPTAIRTTVGVAASFVVTALSHRYVEEPFLRWKDRFQPNNG